MKKSLSFLRSIPSPLRLKVRLQRSASGPTVPGKYVVVLGEWDRQTELDTYVTVHQVVERIRHPQYNPANYNNDIALWRINPPADLNHFRPVCLPHPGIGDSHSFRKPRLFKWINP